jgi:hypothetical protein
VVAAVVTVIPPSYSTPVIMGVIVEGEKLHEAPVGNPEQLNVTEELNPSNPVILTKVVALRAGSRVNDCASIEKAKSA